MKHHTRPAPQLTERQKEQKLCFCLAAAAASMLLAMWGFAWTLAAAADGAVSVLHLCALSAGALMARVFVRIADRA